MGIGTLWLQGLAVIAVLALLTWLLSLRLGNVAIVDSLWSLMLLLAGWGYAFGAHAFADPSTRTSLVLGLTTVWALRLSLYITWRNWGHGEDRRYQAIRARNQPHFALKSLYLVFLLQALLAWIVSLPLLGAVAPRGSAAALGALDGAGATLWLLGFVFEAGGTGSWRASSRGPTARAGSWTRDFGA